jgi:C-terminal processing protease CtpA/Prc
MCGCLAAGSVAVAAERSASFIAALESIRADELREHVEYLSDDKLKGREAGSAGGRTAGNYLASEFAGLDLRAAGVDGGYYQPFGRSYRNVLAMIEGTDPELRSEFILVAAHYDHVGYGTRRNSRGPVGQIHNGADDNASGTSGLLELAEAFATLSQPPRRSVLFVGWDAEEKGLLGSLHWRKYPTLPLEKVILAVSMDMIGSLRNDRLIVYGSRSGYGSRRLLSLSNESADLKLVFDWDLKANSDHYTMFQRNIPVLLFNTGLHDHYHTPRDDAHRINSDGMRRVVQLLFAAVYDLAEANRPPRFRSAASRENEATRRARSNGHVRRPSRLGIAWTNRSNPETGLEITRVAAGSAADRAGFRPGDRILRFDEREIRLDEDLFGAVAMADGVTSAAISRPDTDAPVELTVELEGKPLRLGISWRLDEAEPGTLILTRVVPGTPAARAGLKIGDRIYQIGGRDFGDDAEFAQMVTQLRGPFQLLVERDGQTRLVEIHFEPEPPIRAARFSAVPVI